MSERELVGVTLPGDKIEELWIATGLRKPWRVCSMERTYGEYDDVDDAHKLRDLLVDGNPHMRRLA